MSRKIKIYSDTEKGCIFFDGSTVEPKFIGTIIVTAHPTLSDRVIIKRTDRLQDDGISFRVLFRKLNIDRIQNRDGENLVDDLGYSTADVVSYINEQSNNFQVSSSIQLTLDDTPDFSLDDTSTTILLDNGDKHAVNSIKAILGSDNLIDIVSHGDGDITHYENIDPSTVTVAEEAVSGGPSDVVNTLNELFTAGPFQSVVISDPYSTMVADVNGVEAGYTLEGADAIDPEGGDIFTNSGSSYVAGLKSTATIDQAGEYYTFDIRGEGLIGFGLVHTQESYDAGKYDGNASYANPANFAALNSTHYGFQFSHWFHPTPNGSWSNYGANTSYSMRSGWSNFNGTDEQADWLAGNPIKVKCGIDENGFISIATLRNGTDWVVHARSGYPVPEGGEYHLGIKSQSTAARVFSAPKVHLLEPEAPTMYFRYIESPDGVFHYPLFATAEEANYYDEIVNGLTAGTGSSHTHTYADDPTSTIWHMPEASHDASSYTFNSAPSGTETFNGNAVNYTEITSLSNADLTPPAFAGLDVTQEEATNVNLQVTPAGATWSTSVSISPSGSGLVYDGYSLIQGTLADVGSDTTYTVTVTRANSYGSSVGSFTVTATDVAPVPTYDTPWTKALDFSGSNEHLKDVSSSMYNQPLQMNGLANQVTLGARSQGETSDQSSSRPWATAVVFKSDGNYSNQIIWNQGEGSSNGNDNIYLRVTASNSLIFGWGRQGTGYNECRIANQNISSSNWYGAYIAHSGERLGGNNASASNLADCFDIRLMSSADSFSSLGSNLSVAANWVSSGYRMDRTVAGDFTVGGRGNNNNFYGKVASMVVTTLIGSGNYTSAQLPAGFMPDADQAKMMITDPIKWVDDYKVRHSSENPNGLMRTPASRWAQQPFLLGSSTAGYQATQVWLMGDGASDSYANGIRNYVNTSDQNFTRLQLNSMVSNDIQNVNIPGLT